MPNYNIENDVTYHFRTDFSYDTIPDYNISFVKDYNAIPTDYRKDLPNPVTMCWELETGTVSQTAYVADNEDYTDAWVYELKADTTRFDVYNLLPGKTYYTKVVACFDDSDPVTVCSLKFHTEGQIRWIKADGTFNVRDMGGWKGLQDSTIKYGKIFRGGRLRENQDTTILIEPAGIKALREVGIRAELDLRTDDEANNINTTPLGPAPEYDYVRIHKSYASRMGNFDTDPASIIGIKQIISWLKEGKPAYYHCSMGADRTGTIGFLIGGLLGMSEGDLAKEYELTTFCDPMTGEEGWFRVRTYEGKSGGVSSNEDEKSYQYAAMIDQINTYPGANINEKIYNHLHQGIDGINISSADLAWFIKEMTGVTVYGGVRMDTDTIRLAHAGTHQLVATPLVEGTTYKSIEYICTGTSVATVSTDGLVTAVGGGECLVIVNCDGDKFYIPVIVDYADNEMETAHVTHDIVFDYLKEAAAEYAQDAGYTMSVIDKYDSMESRSRTDCPITFNINWNKLPSASECILSVSSYPDFSDDILVNTSITTSDTTYTIDNAIPGRTLYFKIEGKIDNQKQVLVKSAIKIVDTVRMIRVQGVSNIRDLGGWTGMNGHTVRYGVLYRGARLRSNQSEGGTSRILSHHINYLRSLNIDAELDLRTNEENSSKYSVLGRRAIPYYKVTGAWQAMGDGILSNSAYIEALSDIISTISQTGKYKGMYLGSSYGAERLGTLVFLINGLLGVDETSLGIDYELSSFSIEDENVGNILVRRTDPNYVKMVNHIKSLNGATLQEKIFKYFNEGVQGVNISADDLKWFISYMLDCPVSEVESSGLTGVTRVQAAQTRDKIYDLLGREVVNPTNGIYIVNGRKYIINNK